MSEISDSFFVTDKPNGIPTHQVDSGKPGWLEHCESLTEQKLWVIHRLDKTTSGCLVFAKSTEAAELARRLFEGQSVKKRYLFITDRLSQEDSYRVSGKIIKARRKFQFFASADDLATNSSTSFKRLKRSPFFELWEALPSTGKPHQIRLHAAHLNLPVLGDTEYGGSQFPTLCLHSASIEFPDQFEASSFPPLYFERLGLLRDVTLISWLFQLDQRERLYQFLKKRNIGIRGFSIKTEQSHLILDILGPVAWLHCYPDIPSDKLFDQRVDLLTQILNRPIQIYGRQNRGKLPLPREKSHNPNIPSKWEIQENNYHLELRSNQGSHYGIFLDQRLNRKWISGLSQNKKVLNLFCYTGGFSTAAAVGGAQHVTSVDISKTYLEWGKRNFLLNRLNPEKHQWINFDATQFLKKLVAKSVTNQLNQLSRFDLIICDPPTFARTDKGVFRLEKEYLNLIKMGFEILFPGGTLLFSCNLESLSPEFILKEVTKALPNRVKIELAFADWDYALGADFGASKVLIISKP